MSLAAGVRRKLCCEIRLLLRLVAGEDLGVETEHRDKYDKCFGSAIRLVRFFFLLQYNTCIKLNISPFFFFLHVFCLVTVGKHNFPFRSNVLLFCLGRTVCATVWEEFEEPGGRACPGGNQMDTYLCVLSRGQLLRPNRKQPG